MTSRSQMDTPAMVVVLLIAAVLLLASAPYTFGLVGGGSGDTDYTIAWTEVEEDSLSQATGSANQERTIQLAVEDVHPANAVIELSGCNDGATAPLQQPATISWTLEWESHSQSGTASCAQQGPFTVAVEPQPDVGSADGSSASDAEEAAYEAAGGNETVTFLLTFSWSRPGAPAGLPLPPPAFSATVNLAVTSWVATANVPDPEAPR